MTKNWNEKNASRDQWSECRRQMKTMEGGVEKETFWGWNGRMKECWMVRMVMI